MCGSTASCPTTAHFPRICAPISAAMAKGDEAAEPAHSLLNGCDDQASIAGRSAGCTAILPKCSGMVALVPRDDQGPDEDLKAGTTTGIQAPRSGAAATNGGGHTMAAASGLAMGAHSGRHCPHPRRRSFRPSRLRALDASDWAFAPCLGCAVPAAADGPLRHVVPSPARSVSAPGRRATKAIRASVNAEFHPAILRV